MADNPRKPRRFITDEDIETAKKMTAEGKTRREIGTALNCHPSTISKIVGKPADKAEKLNRDFLDALADAGFSKGAGEDRRLKSPGHFKPIQAALTGSGCGSPMQSVVEF